MTYGVGALSAVMGVIGVGGAVGYLLPQAGGGTPDWVAPIDPNTIDQPQSAWRAMTAKDFPIGTPTLTVDPRDQSGVYVLQQTAGNYIAFTEHCTHLQCPVTYYPTLTDKQGRPDPHFICPCHASTFTTEGIRTGGPAPTNLPRYGVRPNGDAVEIGRELSV